MYLKKLELYNFRNYTKADVLFDEGLNVVVGANAQGKTNLIEAVYLLATGTSPRIVSDKELIKLGCEKAKVAADVITRGGETGVEMILSRKSKKCASVNGLNIVKIGELIGNIRAIYFSPDEMSLIKDSPDFRRKFMDVDLSQISRPYFYTLNKYNKVLKQRNSLLKGEIKKNIEDSLDVWDEQLVADAAEIIIYRRGFIAELASAAKEVHSKIAEKEELNIEYSTTAKSEEKEEIAKELKEQLKKNRERDLRLGFTSVGPQRDDIKITLSGSDLRTFGSQGQQRTATLALKLAEIEIFEKMTGEKPILLLDDVLSELDAKRRIRLLQACESGQTIITCVDSEIINTLRGKTFTVTKGTVK